MTKDDLRRTDKELKQYRTKSHLSEIRNKELSTQVTDIAACYLLFTS